MMRKKFGGIMRKAMNDAAVPATGARNTALVTAPQLVKEDSPVFVDADGRRVRRSVWAGSLVFALCAMFMALLLVSLTGDRVGPQVPPGASQDRPARVVPVSEAE